MFFFRVCVCVCVCKPAQHMGVYAHCIIMYVRMCESIVLLKKSTISYNTFHIYTHQSIVNRLHLFNATMETHGSPKHTPGEACNCWQFIALVIPTRSRSLP